MTPLYAALLRQLSYRRQRLHMPGHKGSLPEPLDSCAPFDLTELPETGCLCDGEGPMLETEARFSALCRSGAALLSAGGSTLCIQTMLALFCPPGSKLLMPRSSHLAAINAAALLGLEPIWLYPDTPSGVLTPGRASADAVRRMLAEHPDLGAVYLTSPDYFGSLWDVSGIADICRAFGVPLLVDNAHGAHLALFDRLHPITLGADCCCDSLHKTLPALTGAALLHLKDGALKAEARRRMTTFCSTSPSYLVMLSADLLTERWNTLAEGHRVLAEKVSRLREAAAQKGVWAGSGATDPTRISLLFPGGGREEAVSLLYSLSLEAEYVSERHIVLIPSPDTDFGPLFELVSRLPVLSEPPSLPAFSLPETAMRLRDAVLSPAEEVSPADAVGRIAAAPMAVCPPGLPLVMPGEVVSGALAAKLSGMRRCFVVQ